MDAHARSSPAARNVRIDFPQHSSALLEALNRHRLEGKFCDVSVLVQGRELRAHKAVLAAASPYFHDKLLLDDTPRLSLPSVIEADAFEGLLQLIYSGHLLLPLDALPAHLLVASGLQMWQVVDQCSEILKELEAARRGASLHPLAGSSSGAWCVRPAQPLASTESPAGGEGNGQEEVLQIEVKEEEDEEEEEEEEGRWAEAAHSQRVSRELPRAHGSQQPKPASLPRRLPEGDTGALEPPAPPVAPPQATYARRDSLEFKGEIPGGGIQSGGGKDLETKVLPGGGDPDGNRDLRLLLSAGAGTASAGGGPSWKPVDLHGNEILSGGGGPGGAGQAVHGPVKLGGAPPADGKRFGCLCGKRFAVKPKRDRHIMLTFSLRPFGCGVCNKRFKLKHHLTEHMKTHAGALHDCPYCGRQFRVYACYLRHLDLCKSQGWSTAHWTYK